MKQIYLTLLLLATLNSFSQAPKDSLSAPFTVSGFVLLINNGISAVPAFSAGKPAVMTSLTIRKNHFSFTPQFNYILEGRPWSTNSWLRYQITKGKFTYRTGANLSLFFKKYIDQNVEKIGYNQYLETELAMFYQANDRTSINLVYWHDDGIEKDAVPFGNFISLSASISKIPISKGIKMNFSPNLFYTWNGIPFKGLFISSTANFEFKNFPFSFNIQAVEPITADESAKFIWNYGLNWAF
jgi:hypothetical protein